MASGAVPVDTQDLRDAVTVEGVRAHQAAFQAIADANGGVRNSGSSGYDDSADYVADEMLAAGYDVTIQEFDFPFFQETDTGRVGADRSGSDGVSVFRRGRVCHDGLFGQR